LARPRGLHAAARAGAPEPGWRCIAPGDRESAGKESAEAIKQQAELTKAVDAIALPLLKNPRLKALHPSVHRLAEALRIRYLLPATRMRRLADGLKTMGPPDAAAAKLLLLNHEFRACGFSYDCTYIGPAQTSDLVQWLSTVRGFDTPGSGAEPNGKWRETLSWSRYQRTHELTWLMAAASLVPVAGTADDKREAELQRPWPPCPKTIPRASPPPSCAPSACLRRAASRKHANSSRARPIRR
jgi:hypothetical protein